MPGLLDGKRRWQVNVSRAYVLAIDIDNGFSINDALSHPFIKGHAALGIESSNSKVLSDKNPDGHEKFRIIFRLSAPCVGWKTIRICNQYLIELLKVPDKSCKDASRFFFGAENRKEFLYNENALLPASFIDDALTWHESILTQKRERIHSINNEIISRALSYIPARVQNTNTYEMYVAIAAGVVNDLGDEGIALLHQWDDGRGDWGNRNFDEWGKSVINSHTDTPASVGTLFYWARQYGFEYQASDLFDDETIRDSHKKLLTDLGIDLDIAIAAGIRSINEETALNVMGVKLPGLLFPYFDKNKKFTGYSRLRVDWEDVSPNVIEKWTKNGELFEYVTPWGVKETPYVPLNFEWPTTGEVVITAGEINVISLCVNGFQAIGLAKEWGWKDNENWDWLLKTDCRYTMLPDSRCYSQPTIGYGYSKLAMTVLEQEKERLTEDLETSEAIEYLKNEYLYKFKFTLLSNELDDGTVNDAASYCHIHGSDSLRCIVNAALPLIRFDEKEIYSLFTTEPCGDRSKKLPTYGSRELIRVIIAQTLKTTRLHVSGINDYRYDAQTGIRIEMD